MVDKSYKAIKLKYKYQRSQQFLFILTAKTSLDVCQKYCI